MIHRDLKPDNIMFTDDKKTLKIIDFGFVTELVEGKCGDQGTRMYMAPEQFSSEVSLKTDVWAFGCILLELVTGKLPYSGVLDNKAPD